MKTLVLALIAVLPAIGTIRSGFGQEVGGAYRPGEAPFRYVSTNEFRMWLVQGSDTVGEPAATRSLEVLRFGGSSDNLVVAVEMAGSDFSSRGLYGIDGSGRIHAVDGVPVAQASSPRVDLLPRIPLDWADLRPGAQWADTVSQSGEEPYGPVHYRVDRRYSVVGEVDAFGARALLLVADGEISLRQGGWQDPDRTVRWWQEASGPVVDSVWLDLESRRLVANATHLDIAGTAGFVQGERTVTMPSGLRSTIRRTPE